MAVILSFLTLPYLGFVLAWIRLLVFFGHMTLFLVHLKMQTNVWLNVERTMGREYQPGSKKHQHCEAPPRQPPFLPKEANPDEISLKIMLTFSSHLLSMISGKRRYILVLRNLLQEKNQNSNVRCKRITSLACSTPASSSTFQWSGSWHVAIVKERN